MAYGYMKKRLDEKGLSYVEIKTAGVMTIAGLVPTPEAKQVLEKEGIDISRHRSAPLTPELIAKADIILGMTPFHVQFALRMSEDAKGKTHLLKEYTKSDLKNYQITDPMGATLEVYKRVFREIRLAVDKLVDMEIITKGLDEPDPRSVVALTMGKAATPEAPPEEPPPARPGKAAPAAATAKKPGAAAPPAKVAKEKESEAPVAKDKDGAKKPAPKPAAPKKPSKEAAAPAAKASKEPAKAAPAKAASKAR